MHYNVGISWVPIPFEKGSDTGGKKTARGMWVGCCNKTCWKVWVACMNKKHVIDVILDVYTGIIVIVIYIYIGVDYLGYHHPKGFSPPFSL